MRLIVLGERGRGVARWVTLRLTRAAERVLTWEVAEQALFKQAALFAPCD